MKRLLAHIKHWFGVHTYKATLRHPLKWQKVPSVEFVDVAYADPSALETVTKCIICGANNPTPRGGKDG